MRRGFIVVLLIAVMVLAGEALAADGSGAPMIVEAASVSAAPGATVSVDVLVRNNPGIAGAKFTFTYDEDLTLVGGAAGEAFKTLTMTQPGTFVSPCSFAWDGMEACAAKDGVILTLTFVVSDSVPLGTALPVKISCDPRDVVDNDIKPIPAQITTINGSIIIEDPSVPPKIESAAGRNEGGQVYIQINSRNNSGNAKLVTAAYSDANKLLGCKIEDIYLTEGENDFSPGIKYANAAYRAFLLDGNWNPCCPAIEIKKTYQVTFLNYDGTTLSTQYVAEGDSAIPPEPPERDGWVFDGWDAPYGNITSDTAVTASYSLDTSPAIVVEHVSARKGEKDVQVVVSMRNNPGICTMTLNLSYDNNALTLKEAVNGAYAEEALPPLKPVGGYRSPCGFTWDGDGESAPSSDTDSGEILILKFDVAGGAAEGIYPLTFSPSGVYDNDVKPVELKVSSGGIHIG